MKRILIIGNSGGGKSTMAAKMAQILDLPLIHLDTHFWQPGWTEPPDEEWHEIVKSLISREKWIMDGNFSGTLTIRAERADTIILLDMPRYVNMTGIFRRVIKYYGKRRPDLPDGCPEKFDWQFTKWVWNFKKNSRPKMMAKLEPFRSSKNIITLKSRKEVNKFVENLRDIT